MLTTPRCNVMLPNSTQCPNGTLRGTELCLLHTQIAENNKQIELEKQQAIETKE